MRHSVSTLLCLIALAAGPSAQGEPRTSDSPDEGLRQEFERTVYSLHDSGDGNYRGTNPAQQLSLEFSSGGARLIHSEGDVSFRLLGYGYGERLRAPEQAKLSGSGPRLEYRRGKLTEWYVNQAQGLEQGFTLAERPDTAHAGKSLVIALGLTGGLHPVRSADGDAVLLVSSLGTVLRYGGLRAWDALGRQLVSRIEVGENQVRLKIEDNGAQYPLVADPVWSLQQELTASDGAPGDIFGSAVSVSGDTAVIAAVDKNGGQGAAYVFVRSGGVWSQQQELTASDPGTSAFGDYFGSSVSVSGDTAVIGAPFKTVGSNTFQGAAYIFVRSGTVWTQQQELSSGVTGDDFGYSVSVSGETVVIGGVDLYVFVRSGTVWSQQQQLAPSDHAVGDIFPSVSVNLDTAVIGVQRASNSRSPQEAAYVFVRSGTVWSQQRELTASDGIMGDNFGAKVSVSGDTAVIAAPQHRIGSNAKQGAAYVFVRSGTMWSQQQELTASDGFAGDALGQSLSIDADTVAIGNTADTAYVFVRSGTVWSQQQELTAPDGAAGDAFGVSVSVSGDTAVIGSSLHMTGLKAGAVYVFVMSPALSVGTVHVGTFTQRGTGEWDVTVNNAAGASATTGTTNVSDALPAGYTVNAFTGTDPSWSCAGTGTQTATCTSTAAVNGGGSFRPVKIVVNIPANSPVIVMNTSEAFGGGDPVHNSLATAATGSDMVSVNQVATQIKATAGTPQSAAISTAFAVNLQATVQDAGNVGISGVNVTFQAPGSGPSGAFGAPCSGTTCVVAASASGVATAPPFTANNTAGGPYNVTAMAGTIGPADFSLTNTVAAAAVLSVTSSTPNGTYGKGQSISIQVTLSNTVNVTGTPNLSLNSGGVATYSSGSGANILNFTYAVGPNDSSAHLDYASTGALTLNGGTIQDAAQINANLTLAAPGAAGSLGANTDIVIGAAVPAPFFTSQVSLGSGVYYLQFPNGNLFGYYNLTNFPIFFHYDLGFEAFIDAKNGGGAYLFDFTSGHWFYSSPSLFPYLYDFTLNNWLYYFPDTKNPGHYTTNPRYFSNLTTGKIISM